MQSIKYTEINQGNRDQSINQTSIQGPINQEYRDQSNKCTEINQGDQLSTQRSIKFTKIINSIQYEKNKTRVKKTTETFFPQLPSEGDVIMSFVKCPYFHLTGGGEVKIC